MRMCFISFEYPPSILGGLGIYADILVRGLEDKGIDVVTIARGDRKDQSEKILRVTVPDVLYWRRFFFIQAATSLFHRLNMSYKFDLVHLNGAYPIARSLKIPTVCTFHSTNATQIRESIRVPGSVRTPEEVYSLTLKNPIGFLADIFSARISDRIICPCPSIAEELRSYCFAEEEKLRIVPNGIDLKSFDNLKASGADVLDKYDIKNEKFILFVGRLIFLKGVHHLIRAFELVREDCRDLKLVIMGTGASDAYFKQMARHLKGVIFTGHVASPAVRKKMYESCLALVVPSLHDTLPTVIMEAMACSKPVIGTNVAGIPLMVNNGRNGFLVKPKDSESIAHFIKMLYDSPELRRKMGSHGRRLMEKMFTSERMVTETLKLYKSLLQSEA